MPNRFVASSSPNEVYKAKPMSMARSQYGFRVSLSMVVAIALLPQATLAPASSPPSPLEDVARLLEGSMDTTAQAATQPPAPSVRMTTCRISVQPATLQAANLSPATILLYQEQALTRSLERPYRQRWLAIAPHTSDKIASISFKPSQPQALIGLCDRPLPERRIPAADLAQPICTIILSKTPQGYRGSTPPQGCPANVRNAVRITNEVDLTPAGMDTWDRGFDASGQQVWGAKAEAYQFRRSP